MSAVSTTASMSRAAEGTKARVGRTSVPEGLRRPAIAASALAVILILSVSSCGLFDTRDSEPPLPYCVYDLLALTMMKHIIKLRSKLEWIFITESGVDYAEKPDLWPKKRSKQKC